jgi:asparagine synthase (glutamine-hydrolysing)
MPLESSMGDFLLDTRVPQLRRMTQAGAFLRFLPDMHVYVFDYPELGLVLTSADDPQLWGPYLAGDRSLLVALNGRISLDEKQWNAASKLPGSGGLACKYIASQYALGGISAVENLSGNFVAVIFDRSARKLFVVTDRWGFFPAFKSIADAAQTVLASHPDALADALGQSSDWDTTSFAEFILAGKLSAPFTYYDRIRALPAGSTTEFAWAGEVADVGTRNYFKPSFRPEPAEHLHDLACAFADAFRKGVQNRTLPLLGRSAVALSGGLDSRTILCAAGQQPSLVSFCSFDQENLESHLARMVARELGVEFLALKRPFDYYADHAELGSRISGGMGCIASNHFLGFRGQLKQLGVSNLLTGCYCDYVFKGLALNTACNPWTTRETLAPLRHEYYAPHFDAPTSLAKTVGARLDQLYPLENGNGDRLLRLEQARIFPLSYEADNAERMIPQRVMGWYLPIAENDLMDIYLRMPLSMKLNRALFVPMVKQVCGERLSRIPDANTGAEVGAPWLKEAVHCHLRTMKKAVAKIRRTMATVESWPNWSYYVRNSPRIRELWERPNPIAADIFHQVLGPRYSRRISHYGGRELYLFLQLFTLKLWLDQRCS